MKKYLLIITALFLLQIAYSQEDTKTLMTIDDNEISKDEFLRIYNKNKNISQELQKSVDEYIDLFINYKLKVIEAENLGYDTMSTFIKEMDNYTKQLTDAYLESDEDLDQLVKDAYERSLEEVKARHILLKVGPNKLPEDTLKIYNSIIEIRERLLAGESFSEIVEKESKDPRDKIGSNLGWFTAFRMVYPFEIAAYNTPVGEISQPVRTQFGLHLILVDGRRPNRGDVEASHIMTMTPRNASEAEKEAAKQKIEEAYSKLQAGENWDSVVVKYSEHRASMVKGGYLGWLNTGNTPPAILDSVFVVDSGSYSEPFASPYGYHIVKKLNVKSLPAFEEVKKDYTSRLRGNQYVDKIAHANLIRNIKEEYGFKFYDGNAEKMFEVVDSTVYEKSWNPDVAKDFTELVFSIGDKKYTQYDFAKYISRNKRNIRALELNRWLHLQIPIFIDESLIEFERSMLPEKYPELKHLLAEYHDGILLFNLTEDEVWQKAIVDTTGLEDYYNNLDKKYSWEKRIAITKYSYSDSALTGLLVELAKLKQKKNLSLEEISAQLCPEEDSNCVKMEEIKYEKGDNSLADSLKWKKGSYISSKDKYKFVLYYVDEILPAQTKTLDDARGLYTADYQSLLEEKWIEKLRNKYTIDIDQEVLEEVKSEDN